MEGHPNIIMNPGKICRACLHESIIMKSLNDKIEGETWTFVESLNSLIDIPLVVGHGIPMNICKECVQIIQKLELFKKQFKQAQLRLSLYLDGAIDTLCKNSLNVKECNLANTKPITEMSRANVTPHLTTTHDKVAFKGSLLSEVTDLTHTEIDKTVIENDDTGYKKIKVKSEAYDLEEENNEIFMDHDFSDDNIDHAEHDFNSTKTCEFKLICKKRNEKKLDRNSFKFEKSRDSLKIENEIKDDILLDRLKKEKLFSTYEASNKTEDSKLSNVLIPVKNDKGHYECSVCMYRFKRKKSLLVHLKSHDLILDTDDENGDIKFKPTEYKSEKELSSYVCGKCYLVFDNINDFKLHIQGNECEYDKIQSMKINTLKNDNSMSIAKNKTERCISKLKKLKKRKIGRLHNVFMPIKIETEEEYECSLCMRKFTRKSSLAAHIKKHTEKITEKYTCQTCKREFQYKAHLDNHLLSVHTRTEGYTCDICKKKFLTQDSLDTHKDLHKIEKKHQCNICNKAFVMMSTLTDHLRTHTGERPYLCSFCGRGFSQKTNLKQHVSRHKGIKPYKCENCERSFVSKGELLAHKRTHSGAHPFVCDDCGNGFTTSSSLLKHRRIHTGERPYACDLCPMRFAASGTLKNHRRTHTNERPHQCVYCEKAFVQKNDLTSHIRCHTGERPFSCSVCSQSFRKASALKVHARSHLKEPPDLATTTKSQTYHQSNT